MRWCVAALFLVLSACSSGDDSGGEPTVPVLPWGSFRHDLSNAGVSDPLEGFNSGQVRLLGGNFGTTESSPAVSGNNEVYLGTSNGVISFTDGGVERWRVSACETETTTVVIGAVRSSPTLTAGGNLVFGSDATVEGPGAVFALRERQNSVRCLWVFMPPGVPPDFSLSSSPQVIIDSRDFGIESVFIGTAGYVQAINGNSGTARWNFPIGPPSSQPLTSTPALNPNNVLFVTTADGRLFAVDSSGHRQWDFPIGLPPTFQLLPSPAVSDTTTYAIGAGSALFAINPDGTLKWQYTPAAAIPGSPAFFVQAIDVGSTATTDAIIYISDVNGTLYGVRNQTGQIWGIQRCSLDPSVRCRTDSCELGEGTCEDGRCTISGDPCTVDTCVGRDSGVCVATPAIVPVTDGPVTTLGSPSVSSDGFTILGTTDGRVCARSLDGTVLGDEDDPENPWADGCVELGDGLPVLSSSPAIGRDGRIYVTTASGLYVIE
jgi:outer membrane protein assembly factor BamB